MVCVLITKNGSANWCDKHGMAHDQHYREYALDPGEKGELFRAFWDKVAAGTAPDPTMPSLAAQAMNYIATLTEHVANGSRLVLPVIRDQRWGACEPCPHRNREFNACSLCGCPLNADNILGDKLSWEVAKCPDKRWHSMVEDRPELGTLWWKAENAWPRFHAMLARAQAMLRHAPLPTGEGDGIVITGGGKYFASAYCNIRLLRHHGCKLPIELWYFGRDNEMPPKWQAIVQHYDVRCIDADHVRKTSPMRIMNGWEVKFFAVQWSRFRRVLFLDADCFPMRDPTFVFSDPRFLGAGAVFQRDCAAHEYIKPGVLELFGLPKKKVFDLETGAFLIDKQRWGLPLGLTVFLNSYSDLVYEVVYGDKTTPALAALLCGQTYAIPLHSPGGGGGWGLLQKWFNGEGLWQHRIHCKPTLDARYFHSNQNGQTPSAWTPEINTYLTELRKLL